MPFHFCLRVLVEDLESIHSTFLKSS